MLIDLHDFPYLASVPCPRDRNLLNWMEAVDQVQTWLEHNIGYHYQHWAWTDSQAAENIGVAFLYDRDRCLFLLTWSK